MLIIGGANLIFALIRALIFRKSFTTFDAVIWGLLLLLYTPPFALLWFTARPVYSEHGSLISGGDDISAPGLLEYAHDLIYLTVFVQVGLIFSRWALLVFSLIPIYAVYAFCFANGSGLSNLRDEPEEELDQMAGMSRKERRKADRQARKQR